MVTTFFCPFASVNCYNESYVKRIIWKATYCKLIFCTYWIILEKCLNIVKMDLFLPSKIVKLITWGFVRFRIHFKWNLFPHFPFFFVSQGNWNAPNRLHQKGLAWTEQRTKETFFPNSRWPTIIIKFHQRFYKGFWNNVTI